MSDPVEVISVGSSPPDSPFELPVTRNKVSKMCMGSPTTEDLPITLKNATPEKQVSYHSLSDSEDEYQERICVPSNFESNLPETNEDQVFEAIYSPSKLSQNRDKSRVTEKVLERKKLKEMKANQRAEKAKEKAERAAVLEKIRQSKPGECMKYITVHLDETISNSNIGKKAVELLKDFEFKYKVETQGDPCSVTWTREEPGTSPSNSEEKHILFIWSFEKLVTSVKFCNLIDTFKGLKNKYTGFRIYLAIYGLGDYYKRPTRKSSETSNNSNNEEGRVRKRRRTLDVPKEQIDMTLAELEVVLKVSTRLLKNHHELSILLQQITKAIAETPYRKEIEKRDMERCWYARGDSRDCVKVDKDFNGLQRLWLQHLSQFNKSSLDIARSIADFYPSPFALYQAYQNLNTQKEKEKLLQDIQIKKGNISTRRVGPELSRKISLLYSQENGDIYLSQE